MSTLTDYQEARERLASRTKARRGMRGEDIRFVTVAIADLDLILAGPPVSREDVARVIDPEGWRITDDLRKAEIKYAGTKIKARHFGQSADDVSRPSFVKADDVLALYQGATK